MPLRLAHLLLILAVFGSSAGAVAAQDFGTRVAGQHIYDQAGVLTPGQVATLEQRAAAVEQAGAPVVVYLRAQDATADQAQQDARSLMDAWDLQSSAGARDGVVIFLDLQPSDLRHGQAAVFAGQRYVDDGRLSASELQRLTDEVMRPSLRTGDLAGGITQGLDAVLQDVRRAGVQSTRVSTDASESGWLRVLSELLLSTFQLAAGIIAMVVVVAVLLILIARAAGGGRRRAGTAGRNTTSATSSTPISAGSSSASDGGAGSSTSF